ncbi:hypothetical protein RHSIM_Rhsim09G0067400 [Rhododendron simsii]|uniref:Uncharacterized protein n=1 Tax=Rhododendron simsii TaxID=118357 RepID=A0A834LEB3_RHOSS|nr:hypothetical protein RHSIM_Rhsim09G0067400 [Rhododendron simsii]
MDYDIENSVIESTFGNRDVVINPDIIAKYMDYERLTVESITYPRLDGEEEIDMDVVYAEAFEGGVHRDAGGDLKDEYRTMNKNETMDFAQWIFDQLVQFKHDYKKGLNFPFPAMITQLCLANDFSITSLVRLDPSSPGIINATSKRKSKTNVTKAREIQAQAQQNQQADGFSAPKVETSGPSDVPSGSAPQKKGSTLKKLLCKLLCRTTEIQEDQRRVDHKANFYYVQMAEQSGRRYEPVSNGPSYW